MDNAFHPESNSLFHPSSQTLRIIIILLEEQGEPERNDQLKVMTANKAWLPSVSPKLP